MEFSEKKAKMKRLVSGCLITLLMAVIIFPFPTTAQPDDKIRIVVGLKAVESKKDIVDIVRNDKGTFIKEIPRLNALIFDVPSATFKNLKSNQELQKNIIYLEEDGIANIQVQTEFAPNDPGYPKQWGYKMIDAPKGWNFFGRGDPKIIVGVIDTGVDYNHEDLDANVKPSLGYDFYNDDPDPMDDNGHGTHVAGTIAAETDNRVGVAGIAGNVTIMPVKVCNPLGNCFYSDIADGIIWAADHGARILSISIGGYSSSSMLENATQYAVFTKGALVIAAACNQNTESPCYPAAYSWVIGVAALNSNGKKAWYSNYGWENVDIAAPGGNSCGGCSGDILSTLPNNQYGYLAGTSMATPHVSGVAALYWSYNLSFTNKQVASGLLSFADDLGVRGRDKYYGYGKVDAYPPD